MIKLDFLIICILINISPSISHPSSEIRNDSLLSSLNALESYWWDDIKGSWKGGDIDPDRGDDSGMIGWWQATNGIELLVNSLKIIPKRDHLEAIISKMYNKQNISGILESKSFDDSGWVALSWVRAFEETGKYQYLARAIEFYEQIITAWDNVCGGGLYWAGDEEGGGLRYKNAITNELFIMLAMRMYENVKTSQQKQYYLEWAMKTWFWFENSGMIINNGTSSWVIDGLDKDCHPAGEYWTYNQGVILGGLGKLYEVTNDENFISIGQKIALSVIDVNLPENPWLYENGILREHCEPDCSDSAKLFKGVFVRYINYFSLSCLKGGKNIDEKVNLFIKRNAETMLKNDRDENYRFGLVWKGPMNETNAIEQIAAIDLLISDLYMNMKN